VPSGLERPSEQKVFREQPLPSEVRGRKKCPLHCLKNKRTEKGRRLDQNNRCPAKERNSDDRDGCFLRNSKKEGREEGKKKNGSMPSKDFRGGKHFWHCFEKNISTNSGGRSVRKCLRKKNLPRGR